MLTTVSHSLQGARLVDFFQGKIGLRFFLDWIDLDSMYAFDKNLFQKSPLSKLLGKPQQGKLRQWCILPSVYCSGEIVLFWWNCIVVADNWSNNPGHSGLAVSGWRSLYYWIPALFNALLTSAYCCSPSHTIHAQRSKQPMSISWTSFPSNVWSKSSAAELQPYLELNRIYWFSISSTVLTFPEGQ